MIVAEHQCITQYGPVFSLFSLPTSLVQDEVRMVWIPRILRILRMIRILRRLRMIRILRRLRMIWMSRSDR